MNTQPTGLKESQSGILLVLGGVLFALLLQVVMPNAGWIMNSLLPVILIGGILFVVYGEFKIAQNKAVG